MSKIKRSFNKFKLSNNVEKISLLIVSSAVTRSRFPISLNFLPYKIAKQNELFDFFFLVNVKIYFENI